MFSCSGLCSDRKFGWTGSENPFLFLDAEQPTSLVVFQVLAPVREPSRRAANVPLSCRAASSGGSTAVRFCCGSFQQPLRTSGSSTERRGKPECGAEKLKSAHTICFPLKPHQKRSPTGPPSCPPNTVRTRSAQNHAAPKHNHLSPVQKVLLFTAAPEVRTSSHLLLKHSEARVISGKHTVGVRACVCVTE